ncbi:MAG: aminoacetone oxidase family FAD-binding enzyme, partial [Clostridia bacterium]|nr:aminoacetone oxidase family FAD-binding enzyme [Clostridia bacterium]
IMDYDVIIIGGGAAGLACAVRLLKGGKNLKISLIDAGDRFGKKLAATGNGQGNISNLDMTARHYHGGNISLAAKIACANPYAGAGLFDCVFCADEKGRIYPAGKQASALVDDLIRSVNSLGITSCASGVRAERISKSGDFFTVREEGGVQNRAKFVVLCTGGKAQKQFKTDGTSYALATSLGHTLTPLYPSLVQLKTDTRYIKTLKGIRADCLVSAICDGKVIAKSRGDVIFTEYGVSGNAVFSVSSYLTDKPNATLSLEFLPDFDEKTVEKSILAKIGRGWEQGELLSGTLHNQIGRAVIRRAVEAFARETSGSMAASTHGASVRSAASVNKSAASVGDRVAPREIIRVLKNFTLKVTGNLGFDYAQVTKGGINMGEVSDELESRLVKNLFFAGEILDVDGDCGGYNLQWAFTGGMAAADAILKRI